MFLGKPPGFAFLPLVDSLLMVVPLDSWCKLPACPTVISARRECRPVCDSVDRCRNRSRGADLSGATIFKVRSATPGLGPAIAAIASAELENPPADLPAARTPRIAAPRAGPCFEGCTPIGSPSTSAADLHQERIVMRQPSRGDEFVHRHAAGAEDIDNPPQPEGGAFHHRAVQVLRPVIECQPGECARSTIRPSAACGSRSTNRRTKRLRLRAEARLRDGSGARSFRVPACGGTSRTRRRRLPGRSRNRSSPAGCPLRRLRPLPARRVRRSR